MKNLFRMMFVVSFVGLPGVYAAAQTAVAPPPKPADSGPSIETTMKFIQDKLNGIGKVNFVASSRNTADGSTVSSTLSFEVANAVADANQCKVSYQWKTTGDRVMNLWIALKDVKDIVVEPYEQFLNDTNAKSGSPNIVASDNPPLTVLLVRRQNSSVNLFHFADANMADSVAKAMTHAAELCGGGSTPEPLSVGAVVAQQAVAPQPNPADSGPAAASPANGAPDPGPSYDETVRYIQDKIRDAGYPMQGAKLNGVVGDSVGVAFTIAYEDAQYSFSVDGCQSMTIGSSVTAHANDYSNDDKTWHRKDGQTVTSYTIPFASVGTYLNGSQQVPAVFSTHEPIQTTVGTLTADGYHIESALNVMIEQLPPTKAIESGTPDHQDWHDSVWIVPKDLGISWVSSDNTGDEPTNQSGSITKAGLPILMIRFAEPGKGATSTHVAKAIQHLVQLCASHPEQAPKELF